MDVKQVDSSQNSEQEDGPGDKSRIHGEAESDRDRRSHKSDSVKQQDLAYTEHTEELLEVPAKRRSSKLSDQIAENLPGSNRDQLPPRK